MKPPHDFEEFSDQLSKNGPVGLADEDDPVERRALQKAHFMGGYEHVWRRIGAPDAIAKMVYEFETEQHATSYFDEGATDAPPMPGGQIPGAIMLRNCGCGLHLEVIAFRKGNRVFFISAGALGGRFIPAETTALALEQYKAS